MYVYMYVCMYVCMYACLPVRTYVCKGVSMCVCMKGSATNECVVYVFQRRTLSDMLMTCFDPMTP